MELNIIDLCLNCVLDDCNFGFNIMVVVIFIILCFVCGVFVIGGNFVFFVVLSRMIIF